MGTTFRWLLRLLACLGAAGRLASVATGSGEEEISRLDLEPVWSGHPVGFSLLTDGEVQYAAYYDAGRRMTVAQRRVGDRSWTFTRLPSQVGWDSHNYVTLAVDGDGYLHLAGNMHVAPMMYFRSRAPRDASTLERIQPMASADVEKRCTYPRFFTGPDGGLCFKYRDGKSGEGNDLVNCYDTKTRRWRPLVETPLTDGLGQMNAYFSGPEPAEDGYYHVWGTWRDTYDCATNHSLSYARSRDLVHWETAAGKPLALPLSPGNIDIADPVKSGGGLINVGIHLGFDSRRRPLLIYHRYDDKGQSQVYGSRFEDGRWVARPLTDWRDYRWEFGGGGTIPRAEVQAGVPLPVGEGKLELSWRSPRQSGLFLLDEQTLRCLGKAPSKPPEWKVPPGFGKVENSAPGMSQQRAWDEGAARTAPCRYVLIWETLGANRDRPRAGQPPPPSLLRLYRLEAAAPPERRS